jgi:hypothetical protein
LRSCRTRCVARRRAAPTAAPPLAVRKLTRWYVEPVFADQRGYNDALLKLVDELAAEVDRLRARVDELEARP